MRGSAYLPLLTVKSRSAQRLAGACLAVDPGKPGAARNTPDRASAGRLTRLAQRKARLQGLGRLRAPHPPPPQPRPGPPGRPPALQLASLRRAQLRARGGRSSAGSGDARALASSRRGGAGHSHPASCSSDVLIYCNCLRGDLGAWAGRWGRSGGGSWREVLAAAPRSQLLHGAWRRGHRRAAHARCLCARLAPRRAEPRAAGAGAVQGQPCAWGGGSGGSDGAPACSPADAGAPTRAGGGGGRSRQRLPPARGAPPR